MPTFEVEYQRDDSIRLTTPIMSAEKPESVNVTQSVNGAWLFLEYRGQRYSVSVEKLVVAWLEDISQ